MGRVAFLPEEFGRAQEHACAHFPPHHVSPLVDQNRQVAVGCDPILICVPDDGFGCGAYDQFLFETGIGVDHHAGSVGGVFKTVVCHHGAFFGKSFHVFGFAREE